MAEGNKKWGFTAAPKPQEDKFSELAGEHGFKVENFFRINDVSGSSGQPGLSPDEFVRMFFECPSELPRVLAGKTRQESSEPSDLSAEETDDKPKPRRRRMKKRQEKEKKLSEDEEKTKDGKTSSLDSQLQNMNLKSDDNNGHGDRKSKGEKSVHK